MPDTEHRFLVREVQNGRVVLRPTDEAEAEELRRLGQGDRVVEAPARDVSELQIRQRLERQVRGERFLPFADSALNAASAGMWSQLIREIDPVEAERTAVSMEINDGWSMAGAALGNILPAAGALRGAGSLGALSRLTAPGATAALGRSVADDLAVRLAPRLGDTGARAAGGILGATIDAAASGAALTLEQSLVQNEPITNEQLFSNIGLSGALGLGIGAVFDGGGALISAGRRRVANSVAERLRNAGFDEGAARLSGDQGVGRVLNPVARLLGSGGEDLSQLSSSRVRQLAVEGQREVDTLIRNTAETLDQSQRVMGDIIPDQATRASRFAEMSAQGVDHMALRRAANGFVQGTQESLELLRKTVINDDARKILSTAQRAVASLDSNIPGVRNKEVLSALAGQDVTAGTGHLLASMDNTIQALENIRLPIGASDEARTALNHVSQIRESLDKILRSESVVGQRIAAANDALGVTRTAFRNAEAQLLKEFGRDVAEGDVVRRQIDGEKIASMFREMTDPRGDRRLAAVYDYLDASEQYRAALRETYGVAADEAALLDTASRTIQQAISEGSERVGALNTMRNALVKERGEAGFSIVSGISGTGIGATAGALLGSMVGAPIVGAAGGAVAGMVVGAFLRPASFYARLAHVESALRGTRQRQVNAMSSLRRTLSGKGPAMRSIGGAGTRKLPVIITRLQSEKTRREEYQNVVQEIRDLVANPAQIETRLSTMIGELADFPPGMYEAVSMQAIAGLQYLAGNLPAADEISPFSHLYNDTPSQVEMDIFVARFRAIEDPLSVLERTATLQVLPEEVDALRVVYPALYQQIAAETASMLSDLEKLPPYQARVAIGTLLELPIDESLSPSFVASMQRRSAQTPQQQQTVFGGRRSRSVQVAGDTYSESQQLEMRL